MQFEIAIGLQLELADIGSEVDSVVESWHSRTAEQEPGNP